MIIVKCKVCKKEIRTYLSRIKVGRGLFCSNECKYKFRKGRAPWNTGKKCLSLSRSKMGDKNPNWKGGIDKKESNRKYGIKNRKQIMLKQAIWNKQNIKKNRKYKSKWDRNNRERRNIIWNRRRTREIESKGKITIEEWEQIKKSQNHKCVMCGEIKKLTIDHIIPVSKWKEWNKINSSKYQCGDKENIQGLCSVCNSKKGNKLSTLSLDKCKVKI